MGCPNGMLMMMMLWSSLRGRLLLHCPTPAAAPSELHLHYAHIPPHVAAPCITTLLRDDDPCISPLLCWEVLPPPPPTGPATSSAAVASGGDPAPAAAPPSALASHGGPAEGDESHGKAPAAAAAGGDHAPAAAPPSGELGCQRVGTCIPRLLCWSK